MRPVRQPVEQGSRQMFLSHHALPLPKFQVGSDDHGDPLVEGRAELEEEIGPLPTERNEAELIEHQQLLLAEGGQEAREFQLMLRGNQIIDQGGHMVEAHAPPLSAGGQGQPCGHVGFTPSIEMPS